jgi:uncharacterized membrane protein
MPTPKILLRSAAITIALILCLAPARAETAPVDPAILYEVTGLGEGEFVPLRPQPGDEGEEIDTLGIDARGIVLSGAAMQAEGELWVQVLRDGDPAWARASHFVAQEGEPAQEFPLHCVGTEPFWSVRISGEEAVFEAPDVAATTWRASEWLPARGLLGRYMIRLSSGYGTGYLALLRQTCSDGMSDIAYPFETVMITAGQAVRAGCCRRASPR